MVGLTGLASLFELPARTVRPCGFVRHDILSCRRSMDLPLAAP